MREDSKEFTSCNILLAKVATNCPKGGDAGHGGKTIFELENQAGTTWEIEKTEEGLRIKLFGDTEAETFADALAWAGARLKCMMLERG